MRRPRRKKRRPSAQERIAREIAAHTRRHREDYWPFLNNFHCRLPGGLYRRVFEDIDLDTPYADARASRKLRGMTPRSFFAIIDRAIAELELDVGKIIRLQDARTGEIHDYTFPLYVRLREEGFKHYPDLTA
jgi:hypothetical protein